MIYLCGHQPIPRNTPPIAPGCPRLRRGCREAVGCPEIMWIGVVTMPPCLACKAWWGKTSRHPPVAAGKVRVETVRGGVQHVELA